MGLRVRGGLLLLLVLLVEQKQVVSWPLREQYRQQRGRRPIGNM